MPEQRLVAEDTWRAFEKTVNYMLDNGWIVAPNVYFYAGETRGKVFMIILERKQN